jgi:hypothetical protein
VMAGLESSISHGRLGCSNECSPPNSLGRTFGGFSEPFYQAIDDDAWSTVHLVYNHGITERF